MGALDFGEIRLDNGVVTLWDGTTWKLLTDLVAGGGAAGASYVHNQSSALTVWTINHNLGYYPNVSVIDSTGRNVIGEVTQVSINQMTILFSGAVGGIAYLS